MSGTSYISISLSLSAMRPRSRLLSKRNLLLPTIREGTEETVKDLNEANTLHIPGQNQPMSSEDYLLSICHLAHPTFPIRDVAHDNLHAGQLDAAHQRLRMSRHSGKTSRSLRFSSTAEEQAVDVDQGEQRRLMFGNSDPLEYLYGHQHDHLSGGAGRAFVKDGTLWETRSRAHSIPRASSPVLPRERKTSCPHIHACSDTSVPNISPKHSSSLRCETQKENPKETRSEEVPQKSTFKQSLISQWISDCRSAWREARLHACMLPAIAEM